MAAMDSESPLERVRAICMAFPETEERLSHGEPTWFVRGKRTFATFADRHHDDRVAVWFAAAPGAQEIVPPSAPERYFVPPYSGPERLARRLPRRRGRLGRSGWPARRCAGIHRF